MTTKKRFSKKFSTPEEWLRKSAASKSYKQRVMDAIARHPGITLSQARGHAKAKEKKLSLLAPLPPGSLPVEARTPKQAWNVRRSRSVYWDMRGKGISLKEASGKHGISSRTVLRTFDAFYKPRDRWLPQKTFSSAIAMRVVAEAEDRVLIIAGSEDASLIGRHHNAIKKFLETGEPKHLKPFRRRRVRDASGRWWLLETDPEILYFIMERREDEEFYSIYKE